MIAWSGLGRFNTIEHKVQKVRRKERFMARAGVPFNTAAQHLHFHRLCGVEMLVQTKEVKLFVQTRESVVNQLCAEHLTLEIGTVFEC